MKKAIIIVAMMPALLLASCVGGSGDPQKDKVVKVGAEMVCFAKDVKKIMEDYSKPSESGTGTELSASNTDAMIAKGKELQDKANKIMTDNGFKDQSDFETMAKKYDDKEMETLVKAKAKSTCNLSEDEVNNLFKGM